MRICISILSFSFLLGTIAFAQPVSETEKTDTAEQATTNPRPAYDYTQDWPDGRGFHVGNTVPDIPLVDMEGNEVRFSEFLGKRYVLYCWASW